MTHDELLAKIEKQTVHIANKIRPVADECEKEIGGFANALRAVVELHKPYDLADYVKPLHNVPSKLVCVHCGTRGTISPYPCLTIQAIEKELQ